MATGPCGVQFRDAFSCFHYSDAEPKGSDCYDTFKTMQECMTQYPTVYNNQNLDEDKEGGIPGMDLNLDDEEDDESAQYANVDDEVEAKNTKEVAVTGK